MEKTFTFVNLYIYRNPKIKEGSKTWKQQTPQFPRKTLKGFWMLKNSDTALNAAYAQPAVPWLKCWEKTTSQRLFWSEYS
jgi:hypothetical protein